MNDTEQTISTLQRDYGHQNWSSSLRAGPECIGIIAECLLITSRPDMIAIKLSSPHLSHTTLYANISNIAHIGTKTFRLTGQKMELIVSLSNDLARRGGIIENILKFCKTGQGKAKDRHLQRYLSLGREAVKECKIAIEDIKQEFDSWSAETDKVFQALEETTAMNKHEAKVIRDSIQQNSSEANSLEKQKRRMEERLSEHCELLEKTRNTKDYFEDVARETTRHLFNPVGNGNLGHATAALLATASHGIDALVSYIHYTSLQKQVSSMEEVRAQTDLDIEQLALRNVELEITLRNLSSEQSSLDEVMGIVKASVQQMTELQTQIQTFMNFLLQISAIIDKIVRQGHLVHETAEDTEALEDEDIKKDLFKGAVDMSTYLKFAARASEVYTAISTRYLLPMIDGLPKLRLQENGTDEEISSRLRSLNELRSEVCQGSQELAARMHRELKNDIREIVELSAASYQLEIGATESSDRRENLVKGPDSDEVVLFR